jgi:hypothetical protein
MHICCRGNVFTEWRWLGRCSVVRCCTYKCPIDIARDCGLDGPGSIPIVNSIVNGSTAISWALGPLLFFVFLILCTVGLLGRWINSSQGHCLDTGQYKQNKRTQTCIPRLGFEPTTPAFERAKTVHALRGPYTYESGSRVRLGSGSNEPNSSVCGSPRAGLGRVQRGSPEPSVGLGSATCSLLVGTCVGGPEPDSRIYTPRVFDTVSGRVP